MLLVFFFFLRSCLLTVFDCFVSMCCYFFKGVAYLQFLIVLFLCVACFFFFFKELLTYSFDCFVSMCCLFFFFF